MTSASLVLLVLLVAEVSQALPPKRWFAGLPATEHTGHFEDAVHSFALCPSPPPLYHRLLRSLSDVQFFAVCPLSMHLQQVRGRAFTTSACAATQPMFILPLSAIILAAVDGH